jgi:hypothetical protein
VVPREALRDGDIYVVTDENRLEPREIEISFVQSEFACVRSGVEEGERIVLSDVAPAVAAFAAWDPFLWRPHRAKRVGA